jgi:predicted transcriptional regulator
MIPFTRRVFNRITIDNIQRLRMVKHLLADSRFSHKEIAKYTELTLDEIEELASKIATSS